MLSLSLHLRGAYDDGFTTIRYPLVFAYDMAGFTAGGGHRGWRYDELRLDSDAHLVHEIEWWGPTATARWLITANDLELTWTPDVIEPDSSPAPDRVT